MKKTIILSTGIISFLIIAFYGGMKFNQFNYEDTCLDMGGGKSPGNYPICIIEKESSIQNSHQIICTDDAKQCPDGSYVGRVGPNCEFTKCPGEPLKPDFVPTEDNPIQLPENIISIDECKKAGGEVWNSLGKTDYDGELIGKIEEMRCPCACLIKSVSQ